MSAYANPLYGPDYDFPRCKAVRRAYVVCSTPRCGSTAFGMLLGQTKTLGMPLEYFTPLNLSLMRERFGAVDDAGAVAAILAHRSSPNGIFAAKAHFFQIAETLAAIEAQGPDDIAFIRMNRRDLEKQAASYARAMKSNQWVSIDGYEMPQPARSSDDAPGEAEIEHCRQFIAHENAGWDGFFEARGIAPLVIDYEEMLASPAATVGKVAHHLGVASGQVDLASVPLRVQRPDASPIAAKA
jgi:LPS sulfotransferase NodH